MVKHLLSNLFNPYTLQHINRQYNVKFYFAESFDDDEFDLKCISWVSLFPAIFLGEIYSDL